MADPKKTIPIDQLPEATILSDSDESILVQNGSATKKADLGLIGGYLATEQTHSGLNTTNKHIEGAINELKADVDILKTRGSGLNQIQMNLQFVDISEGGN